MTFEIEGLDDFKDSLDKAKQETVAAGLEKLRIEFQAAIDVVYGSHHDQPAAEVEAALLAEFRRRELGDQPQALPEYAQAISEGRRIKVSTEEDK